MTESLSAPPASGQRCGVAAVVGAPNAGKSTLVNALVGQKVAITSSKPQTTRARLLGIALDGEAQVVLVDTPGIFAPKRRLDRAMVKAAWGGAEDADLILFVVDARGGVKPDVEAVAAGLAGRSEPKWLVLNKVDISDKGKLLVHAERLHGLLAFERTYMVSAATGDGLPDLKAALAAAVPEGPWLFPADEVSDAPERLMAAEITREQLYAQLHAELPYASAVETEAFTERPDGSAEIRQQILVARPTQRAIVLGKGGAQVKRIGQAARAAIAEALGRPVHLYLHVKVDERWDERRDVYESMGLEWSD